MRDHPLLTPRVSRLGMPRTAVSYSHSHRFVQAGRVHYVHACFAEFLSTTLENWSVSAVKSEHFSTIGE